MQSVGRITLEELDKDINQISRFATESKTNKEGEQIINVICVGSKESYGDVLQRRD